MISQEKIEKIKNINNDDSDFILKINEYLEYQHQYVKEAEVFENVESLKEKIYQNEQGISTLYLLFSKEELYLEDLNVLKIENINDENYDSSEMYYAGKKYFLKKDKYQKNVKEVIKAHNAGIQKIIAIIDISSISSYPLWNTIMRRRMNSIKNNIEQFDEDKLSKEELHKLIQKPQLEKLEFSNKYDIDLLIEYMKEACKLGDITAYMIDKQKTNETIYLTNEIAKFTRALTLDKDARYEYIYDTVCKDMDEMFSKYGFCNFKKNKCVAQRHKTLLSRYPVPKTDGCCFKVVRKCEHNNKDGTCKVKCLPCKLFTCPYLGKLHIGIRASEIILMRAFLNNKQKKTSIYKFYNSKEFLLKKIKEQE